MKIDFHAHAYPEPFLVEVARLYPGEIVLREGPGGRLLAVAVGYGNSLPTWDIEARLAAMGRSGVDIEILSSPRYYTRVDEASPALARLVNDAFAAVCRQEPLRFRAFAHLPFNNPEATLAELERVLALPGFVGVFLSTNLRGRYLHAPEYLPFWEEVVQRRVPVFMHPQALPGFDDDDPRPLISFPTDTTVSVTKLLYAGLFERFPDLVLVLSHLGGTLPFLARRIDMAWEIYDPAKYRRIPRRPSEYMPRLYLDTALGWHAPAFECARALVGIEHIVYGTDYGFMDPSDVMDVTNAFLESLPLSPRERSLIYRGNAERILRL